MPKKRKSKKTKKTKAEERKANAPEESPPPVEESSEENLEAIEDLEEILEEQEIQLDSDGTPGTKQNGVSMKMVKEVVNVKLATSGGRPSHALRWNLFVLLKKPDHVPSTRNLKQFLAKRFVEESEDGTIRLTESGEELAKILDHYYSIPPKDRAETILGVE